MCTLHRVIAVVMVGGAGLVGGCSLSPELGDYASAAPYKRVHFVGKVPPRQQYRYVGRVVGVAPDTDFVEAAWAARVDIKSRAAELGAAVVKIDKVRLPPDSRRAAGKEHVLLIGRAYRPVPPPAAPPASRRARVRVVRSASI